jgi:hypothetical protein
MTLVDDRYLAGTVVQQPNLHDARWARSNPVPGTWTAVLPLSGPAEGTSAVTVGDET